MRVHWAKDGLVDVGGLSSFSALTIICLLNSALPKCQTVITHFAGDWFAKSFNTLSRVFL